MSYLHQMTDETTGMTLKSDNVGHLMEFQKIRLKMQKTKQDWISKLKSQGVKAAHPNDGWVDRENNVVRFAYPQFNDGVKVGDTIVLGWPDGCRYVEVISHEKGFVADMDAYGFVEKKDKKPNVL